MSYFRSEFLEAAKALAAKDWSNPKVIVHLRAMLRAGMPTTAIADELGWNVATLRYRMRKLGLESRAWRRAHHGLPTSLSNHDAPVGTDNYRPRQVAP